MIRDRANIAADAIDYETPRDGGPRSGRGLAPDVKQDFGKAAAIVVAGTQKKYG